MKSLESIVKSASCALVLGVGGGGDIVGALATARFLEFCGLSFYLGGLPWERSLYDPFPGPRPLKDLRHVKVLHPHAWLVSRHTQTHDGILFTESEMARIYGWEILHIDLWGGVHGATAGIEAAAKALKADLVVGVDVGGDSLAQGGEAGLRSPLADSIMLAALAQLENRGYGTLWGVFGYGSDGELTPQEIEAALAVVAQKGGFLGAWGLTPQVVEEMERVTQRVPTEASAIPLKCAKGARGTKYIRQGQRQVTLTPLTVLTFYLCPLVVFTALSKPAQALAHSLSLEEANEALHALGMKTELDLERERAGRAKG